MRALLLRLRDGGEHDVREWLDPISRVSVGVSMKRHKRRFQHAFAVAIRDSYRDIPPLTYAKFNLRYIDSRALY